MTISHFTGGNTMQPPEPVLSRAEWDEERRIVALLRGGTFPAEPTIRCPRPALTESQARRLSLLNVWTRARNGGSRRLCPVTWPLFDDEPSQRCQEVH